MIFVTDEQRRILEHEAVPMPLFDDDTGKCYMVMPIEFSALNDCVRARIPGYEAIAEADEPNDAALTLALLLQKILE